MVSGSDTQAISAATGFVHRLMMRPLSALMVATVLAFVVRGLLVGPAAPPYAYLVVIVLAAISGVLFSKLELSLRQLRGLELTMFATITLHVVAVSHLRLSLEAATGQSGFVYSALAVSVFSMILLMPVYAIFIPNTWQRCAVVTLPMALAPLVAPLLMRGTAPEATGLLVQALDSARLSDLVLLSLVGWVVAVMGAGVIGRFRAATFEARQSNFYDLQERIGKGGMGEVWRAQHQTLARPAAIKIIRPDLIANGDADSARLAIRRFEREAQATASLHSPNTVAVYDFGTTEDGTFYYVMEYLEGIDLESLVKRFGPLPAGRAIYLLKQVCASLADAHANGLVHRDIKLSNIVACRQGLLYDFAKVVDFGLVKEEKPREELTRLTMDGMATGTPGYMAPEMAVGGSGIGPATDIYSLGCVAFWLLTGRLVFEHDNPMATIVDHVKTEPQAPSRCTELPVPAALDEIVLRCLRKSPAERVASMTELSATLDSVTTDQGWDGQAAESWWRLHRPLEAAVLARAS